MIMNSEEQSERHRLHQNLLDAVKSCQINLTNKQELATEKMSELVCFLYMQLKCINIMKTNFCLNL